MEWFLSGNPVCPPTLLDWWKAQLSELGCYHRGYGEQLRRFAGHCPIVFDQISALIEGIRTHPYSRRHVITTWHPGEMSIITELNGNPLTPTTCHTTVAQFFVSREGLLSMHSYQRSADMLLGVPHNWIQSWALLLWLAAHTETIPDKLLWTFGDAHIYQEQSHLEVISQITDPKYLRFSCVNAKARLTYTGKVNEVFKPFKADDFEMIGTIPAPISTIRPKLL
jgi:thymidylate synthase